MTMPGYTVIKIKPISFDREMGCNDPIYAVQDPYGDEVRVYLDRDVAKRAARLLNHFMRSSARL